MNKCVMAVCVLVGLSACGGSDKETGHLLSGLESQSAGQSVTQGSQSIIDCLYFGRGCVAEDAVSASSSSGFTAEADAASADIVDSGQNAAGVETALTEITNRDQDPVSVLNAAANVHSVPVDHCSKIDSGDYHLTELVTDVFLTAGQSNAAGANTHYEPYNSSKDKVNNRVIVWTERNQWEIADPYSQSWHNGVFPSGKSVVYNHPGFQIGRAIAEQDQCRVVAFISTAAPGMPIDFWRNDTDGHYSYIANKVTNALNALPGKHQVDMIWWMQGEADNDQDVGRYIYKMNDLIGRFRSESWFLHDGYFLANETGWFPYANQAIRSLGHDGNAYTDFSRGEDRVDDPFPSLSSEQQFKTHFNEVSLRKIGDLVAGKYLYDYLPARAVAGQ